MKKIIAGAAGFLSTALISVAAFAQEGTAAAAAGGHNNAVYAMSAAFAKAATLIRAVLRKPAAPAMIFLTLFLLM